jgi:outer membrane protein assembly factor BamB
MLAAACGAPPGPRGWAPAQPVVVGDREFVLAPHRSHVYAVRPESSFVQWQFPPEDRNSYPISQQRREGLLELIDDLDVSAGQKEDLTALAEGLTVSGGSDDALKDALTDTVGDEQRSQIEDYIDATRETENDALRDVRALYGEIAISADAETAYVAAFGGWVFALETATGQTRWIVETGDEMVGGVAIDGDTLYFGTKGDEVYSVDAATGAVNWRFETSGEVWVTPAVTDDGIYVASMDGVLHKLSSQGDEVWAFDSAGAGIASNPAVNGDTVYIGSFDKKLYAVNAADGTMKWSISADNWFWGQPAIADGIVYAPSLDGRVYAVNESDGAEAWRFDAGSPVRSAPALVEGGLVVAARDGDVFKLNLQTGERIGGTLAVGSRIESNLTADEDGNVFVVPHDATLYVINATDDLTASTFQLD